MLQFTGHTLPAPNEPPMTVQNFGLSHSHFFAPTSTLNLLSVQWREGWCKASLATAKHVSLLWLTSTRGPSFFGSLQVGTLVSVSPIESDDGPMVRNPEKAKFLSLTVDITGIVRCVFIDIQVYLNIHVPLPVASWSLYGACVHVPSAACGSDAVSPQSVILSTLVSIEHIVKRLVIAFLPPEDTLTFPGLPLLEVLAFGTAYYRWDSLLLW